MIEDWLTLNGVDGSTGALLAPSLTVAQVAALARGESLSERERRDLLRRHRQDDEHTLGPKAGVDPKNLAETGWGVIFASDADPGLRDALRALLDHRRAQATLRHEHYYREYVGRAGYRTGESKQSFLGRQGAGHGPADPDRVPYYLLIVGDPEAIPFRFQYQLDVQYAVGRLHFSTLEEYARYAQSVVEAESASPPSTRKVTFFGVRNADDVATRMSTEELVKPLADFVRRDKPDWTVQSLLEHEATKARLARLLHEREDVPTLLFTASHGVGFPNGDARQLPHQGALVCQDWPGERDWSGPLLTDHYFAADDLGDDATVHGLMSLHFACYGAGTPRLDDFAHRTGGEQASIAPHAFVARLPQRLLGHPKGGALAVVGHVERAWGYSFMSREAGAQTTAFESTVKCLLEGCPVGFAMEYFNQRYAELATDLVEQLENIKFGRVPDDAHLAATWTAHNDARGYAILGDPATRLSVSSQDEGGRLQSIVGSGKV